MTTTQLIADFYLKLLALPYNKFRHENQILYATVRETLASQLGEDSETIQNIFERMAAEDGR
jgi:hypothetical protein